MTAMQELSRAFHLADGGSVILGGMPFETPVIPAKAGMQFFDGASAKGCRVDSRFRGNDRGLQRPCLANGASTRLSCPDV